MSLVSVSNNTGNASTTLSPASIAPSITLTTAGNPVLICICAALSGAPTISTPAGWTLLTSVVQGTTVALYLYLLPGASNTGGTVTATFNLTNVFGAAWTIVELANSYGNGANGIGPLDSANTRTNTSAGSTAVSLAAPTRAQSAELEVFFVGRLATNAFTNTSTSGQASAWTAFTTQTSTTGTQNAQLSGQVLNQGAAPSPSVVTSGTLASSAAWVAIGALILSTSTTQYAVGGTAAGEFVTAGQGYAVGV